MTSKVNIIIGLFISAFLFITVSPMIVEASDYSLLDQDLTFTTPDVFVTNSVVSTEKRDYFTVLDSKYKPLSSGSYYRLSMGLSYNMSYSNVQGDTAPSYIWDFNIMVGDEIYEPYYTAVGGSSFDICFYTEDDISQITVIAKCSFWTTPQADGQINICRFKANVSASYFFIEEISRDTYVQYVTDEVGNALLEEGNRLQEDANTLQSEENVLQEEANTMHSQEIELQEEANELQEEANETSKSLLDKVTDFFDNFFSRLGEFLLGIIVPDAEELTAFLEEVNEWFSDRLGFIWYPFSFAVDMVAALANGTADTGFQVPEFKLNILGTEYQIWGGMTVDMDAFGIFQYVRIFTSFLLVAGIVKLALDKWDEWIGGHGVG